MAIQLSDHFTYKRLMRFVIPSIIMMVFTSIYSVVDGIFVSNFAGATAFAAVNLIAPFMGLVPAIGFMLGTGGTALVAFTLGTGKKKDANEMFSLLVYVTIGLGIFFTILYEVTLRPVALFLGATDAMMPYILIYGRIIPLSLTFFMLQSLFGSFMVTAEKPKLGLWFTVMAGLTNIVLDALFVGVFKWGIAGAGVATALSETLGGVVPFLYFTFPNSSLLRLGKAYRNWKMVLFRTCTNGISEFLTNVSISFVNVIYNYQLLRMIGENGVSAYGVVMYTSFTFLSVFFGYTLGSGPLVGYHYGAGNWEELKNLFKKSVVLTVAFSLVMLTLSLGFAKPLSGIFVGYDAELFKLTVRAFLLYSLGYLLAGLNIFASAFFTALNNGIVSGILSFSRVLVFQIAAVMLLPLLIGTDGVWLAMPVAELLSLAVSVYYIRKMRSVYHYM